jgi:hypothetical protein
VVNVAVRDSTHVLGGLLYHESNLRIEEHHSYHTRTALAVLCPITVLVHLSYDKRQLSGVKASSHGSRG